MNFRLVFKLFFLLSILFSLALSSCSKKDELVAFEGSVVNASNKNVTGARVQIFNSAEDWLTGHNVVATMTTDLFGNFESEPIFEAGEYFIFIEKYDTSNWEIRAVEQGVYPKLTIPEESGIIHTVDYNNMSAMANTAWKLTNIHREFTKPGATAKEWQSIWGGINNCKRDNAIYFNKDLSMRVSEGDFVCSGEERNIIGTFVPPLIFNSSSCETLPLTAISIKEFEYSGWPKMEALNAKMYLTCSGSNQEVYVYYLNSNNLQVLEVYSRTQ